MVKDINNRDFIVYLDIVYPDKVNAKVRLSSSDN